MLKKDQETLAKPSRTDQAMHGQQREQNRPKGNRHHGYGQPATINLRERQMCALILYLDLQVHPIPRRFENWQLL